MMPAMNMQSALQLPRLLADSVSVERHDLARIQDFTEWWHWVLLLFVCLVVAALIGVMYLFDSRELSSGVTVLLLSLRVLAFGGLLFFFLDLEKRSEHQLVKNSRVLLLLDNSLSMGLRDTQTLGTGGAASRSEELAQSLSEGPMLAELRATHDVIAYRFSDDAKPNEIASFPKLIPEDAKAQQSEIGRLTAGLERARYIGKFAAGLLAFSLLGGVLFFVLRGSMGDSVSWVAAVGIWSLFAGVITLAVAHLQVPELTPPEIAGVTDPTATIEQSKTDDDEEETKDPAELIQWMTEIQPRGAKTRLADSVRYIVNRERGGPVAAIVVMTDGGQNSGVAPDVAIKAAQNAKVPVFTVGLGSIERPINVSVVDLQAPQRVYPGDEFAVVGLIRASGLAGRSVKVSLYSSENEAADVLEDERRVDLGEDGKTVSVRFEMPPKEGGRWAYKLKVDPPPSDHDARDNVKTASVEVVERKNKVLILAGGPTREFRFLRNQLYRDRDTEVHVILQTGQPGISQEADELLFDFPSEPDDLFQYDCVIAFDPDWRDLNVEQVKLLERWVAEKAGGLIVVAGPVYTPLWTGQRRGDRRYDILKGLYPVVFFHQGAATIRLGRFGGEEAWRLDFSREGREAEFLWLEDDAVASEASWDSFEGVYGYYAVREPKKGAQVYARFSDPDTAVDNQLPIYMAGHFYGAGRVFFQASGEMWRIRAIDDTAFEQYYTKLIRWASQGRLLRDSSRGVLLVDQNRAMLGEQVAVTAILQDEQHRPLNDPETVAAMIQPDGSRVPLRLLRVKDGAREGTYAASFTAAMEGDYRLEMKVPGEIDEILSAEVRVRAPDLEVEKPQRNDPLLAEFAKETGGSYYIGLTKATGVSDDADGMAQQIESAETTTFVPAAAPDKPFGNVLRWWLLGIVCGALCLEWTVRRLCRLA